MNSSLAGWRQHFWQFFLKPATLYHIVFLRITFAVFALCLGLVLWPHIMDLYGSDGYMQWVITDIVFKKDYIPNLGSLFNWVNKAIPASGASIVQVGYSVYLFSLAAIAVGWWSNVFAGIAWWLHLLLLNTGSIYGYGVETFIHITLFYCVFMPVDGRLSLWRWWRRRVPVTAQKQLRQQQLARLCTRLLQLHLCLVYANAGLAKLQGGQWYNGQAMWRSLTQFPYNPVNLTGLSNVPWLLVLTGWLVLMLETLYPLVVWCATVRRYFVGAILCMHAGIGILMGLHFFAAIMIILNLAAFGFNIEPIKNNKQLPGNQRVTAD